MERNVLVDRLKGYACFLVLLGHVIMGIRLAGIDIPEFFLGNGKVYMVFSCCTFSVFKRCCVQNDRRMERQTKQMGISSL